MSEIEITTLAERPEVTSWLGDFWNVWPQFMLQDLVADALIGRGGEGVPGPLPDRDRGRIGRARSIPFAFPLEDRTELPSRGWDQALTWGFDDLRYERETNVSSALEIVIKPTHLGRGLSYRMLAAMRDAVKSKGHTTLYAPVRPNGKTDARMPMSGNVGQTREDREEPPQRRGFARDLAGFVRMPECQGESGGAETGNGEWRPGISGPSPPFPVSTLHICPGVTGMRTDPVTWRANRAETPNVVHLMEGGGI